MCIFYDMIFHLIENIILRYDSQSNMIFFILNLINMIFKVTYPIN